MLSKLLKYEIKATARIFLPIFLSLLVFAVISKTISVLDPQKLHTPSTISMVIYFTIMVGMFVTTFIVMIQRFYRNLLSNEGYLMFTLPIKPWKHIASKLLVSMLWIVSSIIAAMISILIITFDKEAINQAAQGFTVIFNQVYNQLGASVYLLTFEIVIGMVIGLASSILVVYASIAAGHLFGQHKILASFGAFILLNTVTQSLFTLVSSGFTYFPNMHVTPNDFAALKSIIPLGIGYLIIFTSLLSVAYFAITNIILSKRLNLE